MTGWQTLRREIDKDYFNFGLANNLRDEKDYDLPTKTSLGEKRSDIVGNFYLKPKDILFMPAKRIVQWNRVVSLLTPSSDLFQSYNPVIQRGVSSTENTSGKQTY